MEIMINKNNLSYKESYKEYMKIDYIKVELILNNNFPNYIMRFILNEYLGECEIIELNSNFKFFSVDAEIKNNYHYNVFNKWK